MGARPALRISVVLVWATLVAWVALGAASCSQAPAEPGDTDSLRILSLWRGEAEIWLVDALLKRSAPGTVHRLLHDEILSVPQPHAAAHFLSLPENLRWMAHAEPAMAAIRYRLWGIEPGRIDVGEGLTPEVARAVGRVAEEIREALAGAA